MRWLWKRSPRWLRDWIQTLPEGSIRYRLREAVIRRWFQKRVTYWPRPFSDYAPPPDEDYESISLPPVDTHEEAVAAGEWAKLRMRK